MFVPRPCSSTMKVMYLTSSTFFILFVGAPRKYFHMSHKCTQAIDSGYCEEQHTRYFYNIATDSCQMFYYGGCGGNDNNFYTETECRKACITG